MNTKELVEYSIKKYGRTYKALGGHWFWKRWYDFLGLFKKSEFEKLLKKGKQMTDYDKYREQKEADYSKDNTDELSGVACPECKEELRVNNSIILASSPPKRNAWCESCGWRGYL